MKLEYRFLFLNTTVSLLHYFFFVYLKNPVSINIEWYSVTLFSGSFQLMFLLISNNEKDINRKILFFIVILILGITIEIIWIGIESYRISIVETIVSFYILFNSIKLFVKRLKSIFIVKNKVILFILSSMIQFSIINIIYNIILFFTYHFDSHIGDGFLNESLLISSIIISFITSIAFIWSPKKESFLKLS
jgi:hypothetical protein